MDCNLVDEDKDLRRMAGEDAPSDSDRLLAEDAEAGGGGGLSGPIAPRASSWESTLRTREALPRRLLVLTSTAGGLVCLVCLVAALRRVSHPGFLGGLATTHGGRSAGPLATGLAEQADGSHAQQQAENGNESEAANVPKEAQRQGCQTPVPGDPCYRNITWAKTQGIWQHNHWYDGLVPTSSRRDFQDYLHRTSSPGNCGRPCSETPVGEQTSPIDQSLEACYFKYNGGPSDECFCKLAGNAGCADAPCTCPQGCGAGVTWQHANSVTFRNKARAYGCPIQTALLTIPKSYFSQVRFLQSWCPHGMKALLEEMFRGGFNSYTENVGPAPVQQCIHAASHVSMSWLHLHTFCGSGHVDGMPAPPSVGWCGVMTSPDSAPRLAEEVLQWAIGLYGPLYTRAPRNCREMGCEGYGPAGHCSCNDKCTHFGDCCPDYKDTCAQ